MRRLENARATAEHWRALARETQTTAEQVNDARERLALLLIARAYEQLANTADRVHRSLKKDQAPGVQHPEAIGSDDRDD